MLAGSGVSVTIRLVSKGDVYVPGVDRSATVKSNSPIPTTEHDGVTVKSVRILASGASSVTLISTEEILHPPDPEVELEDRSAKGIVVTDVGSATGSVVQEKDSTLG
jgi:hypothetical protein